MLVWKTGMRHGELASLRPKDVHGNWLIVRGAKGKKDRTIPLPESIAGRLQDFIKSKPVDKPIFGLTGPSIGMKIKQFARKARLSDFHTHTLRHKYATDVLESGTDVRVLQDLMGHESLNTTQGYLSLTSKHLQAAADRLDRHAAVAREAVEAKSSKGTGQTQRVLLDSQGATSKNNGGDPFVAALRLMLHPDYLSRALRAESVNELQLSQLPAIDKAKADAMPGLPKKSLVDLTKSAPETRACTPRP